MGFYNNLIRTLHLLIGTGKQSITKNPTKFQFGKLDIEFIWFMVSIVEIRPVPQIVDTIRKFPRHTNISRIRAFFAWFSK